MSFEINESKEKAIKELELMSKKIKKRMTALDSLSLVENAESIVNLSKEYRGIKETIIRIIQM